MILHFINNFSVKSCYHDTLVIMKIVLVGREEESAKKELHCMQQQIHQQIHSNKIHHIFWNVLSSIVHHMLLPGIMHFQTSGDDHRRGITRYILFWNTELLFIIIIWFILLLVTIVKKNFAAKIGVRLMRKLKCIYLLIIKTKGKELGKSFEVTGESQFPGIGITRVDYDFIY